MSEKRKIFPRIRKASLNAIDKAGFKPSSFVEYSTAELLLNDEFLNSKRLNLEFEIEFLEKERLNKERELKEHTKRLHNEIEEILSEQRQKQKELNNIYSEINEYSPEDSGNLANALDELMSLITEIRTEWEEKESKGVKQWNIHKITLAEVEAIAKNNKVPVRALLNKVNPSVRQKYIDLRR